MMLRAAKDILTGIDILEIHGEIFHDIEGIAMDSRKIKSNWAFFAYPGIVNDGHQFISKAIELGATLIVCENFPENIQEGIQYIKVKDCRKSLGTAAGNFYHHPSKKIKLVGITGTNGKTTVATLCYQLFRGLGYKTGLLSTIENLIDDKVYPSTHTTSDAIHINELLNQMVEEGCQYAFMEVSSHAIDQDRIQGLSFAGGVFTNISHDHLDYHKTFIEYIYAKKKFFDQLSTQAFALVNKDDKRGEVMLQNCPAKHYTFALKNMADYHARILENNFNGLVLNIQHKELHTQLIGLFNAYNILTAYGISTLLGIDSDETLRVLSMLSGAQGRFEWMKSSKDFIIGIVDYAHTPDALKNVLDTIREVRTNKVNLITIVGCGGDRDTTKRPKMALIASELSDKVIITTDNPRSEEPMDIIEQMKAGIPTAQMKKVLVQVDRNEAIRMAVTLANKGDIILLAGKGHENYQEIKGVKYPFDDKAILQSTFIEMDK
ncbi:MAG TPA: UDP-N-acetylmuramoyl-L-alanyl-D-glutamate--2,6-diaminopimelate ligase [Chitinophagales bacterium]|nr:UDP-N-acetylmuramoyl-L-alanyl-D-glutamate--2,6-diaminopimelate ligase [Chitinophagales bacterium]